MGAAYDTRIIYPHYYRYLLLRVLLLLYYEYSVYVYLCTRSPVHTYIRTYSNSAG